MLLPIFIILVFSIFSFNSSIYWLLVNKTGVGTAYVIDQLLPFGIVLLASFSILKLRENRIDILRFLKTHSLPLLLLLVIAFFVHRWILGFYFFAEAPTSFLAPVTNNGDRLIGFRGYHFGAYVASYLLFGTNVWLYNLLTLLLYMLTTITLYVFFNILTNKRLASFLGTILFIATPSYLTMFTWQQDAPGMLLVILSCIFSLIFLLFYQKKKLAFLYIFSVLFYITAIKMSLGRAAGFIVMPLFFLFLPTFNSIKKIKKAVIFSLPYVLVLFLNILVVFLIPDGILQKIISGHAPNITVRSEPLHVQNYFPALFTWITYLFLPNQFAAVLYPIIKSLLSLPPNFSITVLAGILFLIILLIGTVISLFHLKKMYGKLVFFSIVWIFSNLFFIPLLVGDYHDTARTDWNFTRIDPGSAPGSKYVFFSSIGLSILVIAITLWIQKKSTRFFLAWVFFLLGLFGYYIMLSQTYYKSTLQEIIYRQVIPDKVFSLVPKDGKKKLLVSTNPAKNAIDNQTGTYGEKWLNSFYTYKELFYTNDLDAVKKLALGGGYKKDNVYAFYNNPYTLTFTDLSKELREELFNNKASKDKISLLANPAEITSTITSPGANGNNPIILQRGMYISGEFNYRFIMPKKMKLSIEKYGYLPFQLHYIDAIVTDGNNQEAPFPQELWLQTRNPPLILSRDEVDDVSTKDYKTIEEKSNFLSIFYACAEDQDWEAQNSSMEYAVANIWKSKEIYLDSQLIYEQLTLPIECYGSILRKLIIVGPPNNANIIISKIFLE